MNTKLLSILALGLVFLSASFKPASDAELNAESLFCSAPPYTPGVFVMSDNQSYISARAKIIVGTYDGIEWQVTNGFITGGQGTNAITIGVDCPTGKTVTAQARAFNYGAGGAICYTGWGSGSYYYSGPCFYL